MDFANGLDAIVVVVYHEQNTRYPNNHTIEMIFSSLGFQKGGN